MSVLQTKQKDNAIAKQIHPKLPSSITHTKEDSKTVACFRNALVQMHEKRQHAQNGYEKVITALEEVIEELFKKNDCLNQQRHSLIRQNYELRKQNDSLSNVIEVKKRLGDSVIVQSADIFDILIENTSASRGMSKHEEVSYECGNTIGNILEENSNIANRQEFIIQSNPLSQNISQVQQSQISMSNIGKTQMINHNLQTPGLSKENICVRCSNKTSDGIIRAFYLSVMQKKTTCRHLIEILDSLRHDITIILFEPYPANEFWIDMLCNFLKMALEERFDTQVQVLEYIRAHRLIDTLLIKCLKSRIEFLFNNIQSFEIPEAFQILKALANEFGLRMETIEDQYVFFTKQTKDELSFNDRPSLEISLNNKDSHVYYVKEEEPCFSILELQDCLQFTFFIIVECELGISQYEINEDYLANQQSFKCNESHNQSFKMGENQFQLNLGSKGDHLEGVATILNERDSNIQQSQGKKLTRNFGHRRYNQISPSSNSKRQPLNSSRFFLNRVASKNSSLDQNL